MVFRQSFPLYMLGAALLLCGCPEGNPDPDPEPTTGAVAGEAFDAQSGAPVADLLVRAYTATSTPMVLTEAVTDAQGRFTLEELPGGPLIVSYSDGVYVGTPQPVEVHAGRTTQIAPAPLVAASGLGNGAATGTITDLVSGAPIVGATVEMRKGILGPSNTLREVIASGKTDPNGEYRLTDVPPGTYSVLVESEAHEPDAFTAVVFGEVNTRGQDYALSRTLDAGQYRIVLFWDRGPLDLDAHLTGPSESGEGRFHLYWQGADSRDGSPEPNHVRLQLDSLDGSGPEVMAINQSYPGVYRFSVQDFTNRPASASEALSNSNVRVQLISSAGVQWFYVTPEIQGTLWTVFELDGDTGEVTIKDAYGFETSDDDVSAFLTPWIK